MVCCFIGTYRALLQKKQQQQQQQANGGGGGNNSDSSHLHNRVEDLQENLAHFEHEISTKFGMSISNKDESQSHLRALIVIHSFIKATKEVLQIGYLITINILFHLGWSRGIQDKAKELLKNKVLDDAQKRNESLEQSMFEL